MSYRDLKKVGIYSGPWNNWSGRDCKLSWRLEYWLSPRFFFRKIKWWWQRRIYGIDSRWCYDLDDSFFLMIYVSLKEYLRDAEGIVNLEYHTYTFKGESYTLKALIEKIFEDFEFVYHCKENLEYRKLSRKERKQKDREEEEELKKVFNETVKMTKDHLFINQDGKDIFEEEKIEEEKRQEILEIFALICRSLWW